MTRKLLIAAAALAAGPLLAAGFASNAMANVELELTSGAAISGVIAGTPCGTGSCVTFTGSVGDWTINLTSGFSKGPGTPSMDLSSIDATSAAAATPLTILLSDNGFASPAGTLALAASGHIVSGSGTSTYTAYFDPANGLFAKTTAIGSLGPFSAGYTTSTSGAGPHTTPYSLTEQLVLTAGAGGVEWSTDSSILVPEPGSLTLFGTMLLGLGLFFGVRRKKV